MTDEKKKKVKRYAVIALALVLATGALAFSVWRFVATIQKKIDSKSESSETRITVTTDTRNVAPSLDFGSGGMFATGNSILTNQITFTKGTTDGTFVLNVAEAVYADVADTTGYSLSDGGSFASIYLYIADTWALNSSEFPTVPALTDDVWISITVDLGDITGVPPYTYNVLKNAETHTPFGNGYVSNEAYLPTSASDLSHYVMFAVVPLHSNDGSSTYDEGTWQYFHSQIYRMSDLFSMATSVNGSVSAGYSETDLQAKYDEGYAAGSIDGYNSAIHGVYESEDYQNSLKAKYDEGYAAGTEDLDRYGAQRYNDGFSDGHAIGFSKAQNSVTTGKNLFLAILDAPFTLIRNIFNFEILGINISAVIFFILSVLLIGFVIRKLKG